MITFTRQQTEDWDLDTEPLRLHQCTGLQFETAHNVNKMTDAWRLVYEVYKQSGLIAPNPYKIHTTARATNDRTAVFHGSRDSTLESTLTAVVDGPDGLPLDSVFKPQLDTMRRNAKRLMECCMFAHAGQHAQAEGASAVPQIGTSLINLMRLAFWYGVHSSVSDFVLGVPANQTAFFTRAFGFKQIAPEQKDTTLNNQPVALLHGDLLFNLKRRPLPLALRYCLQRSIAAEAFDRVKLRPYTLAVLARDINGFLQHQGDTSRRLAA